jgi:Fic family protein
MSAQIRIERNAYYDVLEATQKSDLDVTPWLEWFLNCLDGAIEGAEQTLASIVKKALFWETFKDRPLNERQRNIINRLLDGFEGKMTSSKWAKLTKSSADTALRDINDLIGKGMLERQPGGGRSTSYGLTSID